MGKLKPRAIIFDLGSTLIEYESIPWEELGVVSVENGRQFLKKRGIEVMEAEPFLAAFDEVKAAYRREASETLREWSVPQVARDLFRKLKIDEDDRLIQGFFDAYYDKVAEQLYVYDDTLATLERLRQGYPTIGLVSNTIFPERVHHIELRRFGIAPHLDFTVFSSTVGVRKPHEDIFIKATNLAGQAPSDCVYIGDRYYEDVHGPKQLGMAAILKVKPGREYPDEMPLADRRINKLSELFDHIEG